MKKLCALLCVLMMLSMALFANGNKEEEAAKAEGFKGIIKIGVLGPLTGTNAEYGVGFKIGTQMAADRINAAGGANGYKLILVPKDSKGDPKESSDLTRQFCDDSDIMAIIGDFTSGCSMANAPIVDDAKIVQLSPTASNPKYAGMSDYCFSIMGRQDGEAPFFAKYIISKYMGVKKIGLIYINSDWGVSAADNFRKAANEAGVEIVTEVNYVQDEKDFSSLITKLKAANPEALIIMDQGAVAQVINQVRAMGWDVPLTTLGPGTSEQLIGLTGANSEGLILSTPFFFDPQVPELMAWKTEFNDKAKFNPTVHPACAFDCVNLIAQAINSCGDTVTRQGIRDNLARNEYTGITGPIKFNKDGDITRAYLICQVENGQYVVKKGFDYSAE
ncbi:ABC-type branched-chain amino acid transport system, periplasmic component [Sphaerochaeta pleomorpha str. Grapes]|uniref:ABC-type branched-chain amino acid transport system, periplasmic component n=1 Tax=Sphaerochaeta pleomorpha (strain ATCC BAA-1885 / DSM 22778 / Grapes) TaxID=158190 RepID=G8QXH7_SPHPG|nr:ABC transporter substrate-binding protein [Sphaerochaeta pleomorpha]AEV29540.1 ABC-type branched-chain amino acid transport system, periplasmic component [Sphaerochaeta pleomorpha str. Grapes]